MNKTFTLLFIIRKSMKLANGKVPIYLRITIDGRQTAVDHFVHGCFGPELGFYLDPFM